MRRLVKSILENGGKKKRKDKKGGENALYIHYVMDIDICWELLESRRYVYSLVYGFG